MKEHLLKHGNHVLFMDATHKLNQYANPLYIIMVRDGYCNGYPVFYIIIGDDDQNRLELAL